ncbi:hypothetical protein [Nocardia sp. NPDC004750]
MNAMLWDAAPHLGSAAALPNREIEKGLRKFVENVVHEDTAGAAAGLVRRSAESSSEYANKITSDQELEGRIQLLRGTARHPERTDTGSDRGVERAASDLGKARPAGQDEPADGLGSGQRQRISGPDRGWEPEAYVQAFRDRRHVELPPDSTLRGRIVRGREKVDFEVLGSPERSVCFIMGPDGLSMLPGIELLTALERIGLTPHYVHGRIEQGHSFRLLVFNGGRAAPLATWDNALDLISGTRPELVDDIRRHRNALKTTPFEIFQADVTEPLENIDLAGPAHRDYMSLDRYRALSPDERADPAKLRRLLFHVEHLGELFSGDGYTRTPGGQRGLAEYLVPNGRISDLPDARMIDLL